MEVSRKLKELSELRGLRKDIWRIAVALERLASIESQDSDEGQISWPESEGSGGRSLVAYSVRTIAK